MQEYLNYKNAMEYLGIKSKGTLLKYIKNGLPTINIDNSKMISKTAIDEFMKSHTIIANNKTN